MGAAPCSRMARRWAAVGYPLCCANPYTHRKESVIGVHEPIARHLGQDRGGGNAVLAAVTLDDGLRGAGHVFRDAVAINQRVVGIGVNGTGAVFVVVACGWNFQ
jgi:hypothetical protein